MPEVENKPKNLVKNRSPQDHFEGQNTISLTLWTAQTCKLVHLYIVLLLYVYLFLCVIFVCLRLV